jgi:hypothetical protein
MPRSKADMDRRGADWRGAARRGVAWLGGAVEARLGEVRPGLVWLGKAAKAIGAVSFAGGRPYRFKAPSRNHRTETAPAASVSSLPA